MSEYEDLGVTHTVEDNLYDGTGETFDSKLKTATQAGVSVPTMKSTFSAVNLSMGCFQNSKKDAKIDEFDTGEVVLEQLRTKGTCLQSHWFRLNFAQP